MDIVKGKVFAFPKNVDTDQIYPGRFVELTDLEDVVQHAMEGADPEFTKKFKPGDIIVADTNFGCGSSREHAAITLKGIGVGAIIAESFARIFYRNGINLGLPLITCPGISKLNLDGKVIEVQPETGEVFLDGAKIVTAEPFSPYVMEILQAGGIKNMIRETLLHA